MSDVPQQPLKPLKIRNWDFSLITVWAERYGQYALHDDVHASGVWTVSHVYTGYGIASFSSKTVARNFAIRLNQDYDLDTVSQMLEQGASRDDFKSLFDEIDNLRRHETYVHTALHTQQIARMTYEAVQE